MESLTRSFPQGTLMQQAFCLMGSYIRTHTVHVVYLAYGLIVNCHYIGYFFSFKAHLQSCVKLPNAACHLCGRNNIPHEKMQQHLEVECPEAEKPWKFRYAGCSFKVCWDYNLICSSFNCMWEWLLKYKTKTCIRERLWFSETEMVL